jgi:coproporphyrinogen III oxidase
MPQDIAGFLTDVQKSFEQFCTRWNGHGNFERNSWDCPLGKINAVVQRGEVFEKASTVYCDLEIDTPPVLAKTMGLTAAKMRALVLEIHFYPMNPHLPKPYMELRANIIADKIILAGGSDIFPYYPDPETHRMFADPIKRICKKHTVDYEALRKVRADFFKSKYTAAQVGSHAGIYFFQLDEAQFPFFKDMAEGFFTSYAELVEKYKDTPCTPEELQHRLKVHGQLAQWVLLEDEGTRFGLDKGIPPEALLGPILPPLAAF